MNDANFDFFNMRIIHPQRITVDMLKSAINKNKLDTLFRPFDEIDVPLDSGKTLTVVCGCVSPKRARFVAKDCWDKAVMNNKATNRGGYFESKGREHVLSDIWPHIVPEWQAIIKPRTIVESIDGQKKEYADPLWLPSATDICGPSEQGYWKDIDDSFHLPIYKRMRNRVKELGNKGVSSYHLRSIYTGDNRSFQCVNLYGAPASIEADYSRGFAPGFDI